MTAGRALITWLLLFAAAFLNGAIREIVLTPGMTPLVAHQVSCVSGITLFVILVWLIHRVWPFRSRRQAWCIGIAWTALTIAWEFGFGHFLLGYPWPRLMADYAIWTGRLWLLVLASVLVLPAVVYGFDPRRR